MLALCRAQRQAGIDLEVFTTTANTGALLPAQPDGTDFEGVRVRYFPLSSPAFLLGAASMRASLRRAAASASVVHVHGLFNRTVWMGASVARGAGVPYVISPRGMLDSAGARASPMAKGRGVAALRSAGRGWGRPPPCDVARGV